MESKFGKEPCLFKAEVNARSDSKRLELILKNLPDEKLRRHLEEERDKGKV